MDVLLFIVNPNTYEWHMAWVCARLHWMQGHLCRQCDEGPKDTPILPPPATFPATAPLLLLPVGKTTLFTVHSPLPTPSAPAEGLPPPEEGVPAEDCPLAPTSHLNPVPFPGTPNTTTIVTGPGWGLLVRAGCFGGLGWAGWQDGQPDQVAEVWFQALIPNNLAPMPPAAALSNGILSSYTDNSGTCRCGEVCGRLPCMGGWLGPRWCKRFIQYP